MHGTIQSILIPAMAFSHPAGRPVSAEKEMLSSWSDMVQRNLHGPFHRKRVQSTIKHPLRPYSVAPETAAMLSGQGLDLVLYRLMLRM
jgi:hypothetical protein